jgi:membrane protein YqaA with SNARE-associated domain
LADFEEELREKREQLTVFTHPLETFQIFALAAAYLVKRVVQMGTTHPAFLYVVLPLSPVWYVARTFPGPHSIYIQKVEFFLEFVVWWVGLGIMSSIGLGSGLQSGVLFLFPHIIKTCLAAQACNTLDFDSFGNMWFRKPKTLFKCPPLTSTSTPVTFFGLWVKVLGVCFLQTAGTALGEIPPFWMTRAARLAAIEAGTSSINDYDDDVPEELECKSHFKFVNRAKAWIVRFLRTHGFYGILTMASIPNPLFDLCGICCGHYLMPFWSFFTATFIGKAVIRNLYQSLMYVALCGEEYMQWVIRMLQHLAPDSWEIDQVIREIIEDGQASFRNIERAKGTSTATTSATALLFYWQCIVGTLLFLFFLSCISQFAQFYQLTLDQEESNKLRARLPPKVRESLLSPSGSGRLILPPPTPKTGARGNPRVGAQSTVRKVQGTVQAQSTLKPVTEDADEYDCHDALTTTLEGSPVKSPTRSSTGATGAARGGNIG